jgi:hypothetical protein
MHDFNVSAKLVFLNAHLKTVMTTNSCKTDGSRKDNDLLTRGIPFAALSAR